MKKLRITVDGKVFDVSVELLDQVSSTTSAPAPAPVAAPAPAPAASAPVAAPIIYAPASGTLTAFCVSAGDTVQEGQALAKIG